MDAIVPAMLANALVAVGLTVAAFGVAATRRPRAAHTAWLVVLVKLVTPPLVVIPIVWVAARTPVEPKPKATPAAEPAFPTLPSVAAAEPNPVEANPDSEPTRGVEEPVGEPLPVPAVFASQVPPTEPVNTGRIAFFVWISGGSLWLGLVALRVVRFRRFVATATPVDLKTTRLTREVAARLGLKRVPDVSFVNGPVSPMLWAVVGRPRVLLPRQLWVQFEPDHREAVLAHELAHLARGDHWTRRFELMVLAIYWWCPLAWVAVRELRRAEEACCDARVLGAVPGRAAAYAEALVETIAFVNRPGWVPLASGGVARATDLKRRVTMILNSTGGPRAHSWLGLAVLMVGLVVLPLAPGLADEPKPPPVEAAAADEPPPAAAPAMTWRFHPVGQDPKVRIWEGQDTVAPVAWSEWTQTRNFQANPAGLKDEIELLEAQMDVKHAHIRAAERGLKSAVQSFDRVRKLAQQGNVSQEEVGKAEEAYGKAESELEIRKAELKEHSVRLTQAKRRLTDGNTPPTARTTAADPAAGRGRSALPEKTPQPPIGLARPTADADPLTRPSPAPTPARNRDTSPDQRGALPLPAARSVDPTADRKADDVAKRLNDLMDQYEKNQKVLQQMQKQQSDLKKMLDVLMAEQKKSGGDLPSPLNR